MDDVYFNSDGLRLHAVICKPNSNPTSGVLFLHGGGQSNTSRYQYLQHSFLENGITSMSFDFRGCGQSEGAFEDSSLNNRLKDAESGLEYFREQTNLLDNNIYIWGSSMGGHVACRLSESHKFKGLILQSPAAFAKMAEEVKLNMDFSSVIRKPESWANSPAFTALKNFTGKVLVVYGEKDTVIPEEVKKLYRDAMGAKGDYYIIPGGSHKLLSPESAEEKEALEKLVDKFKLFYEK